MPYWDIPFAIEACAIKSENSQDIDEPATTSTFKLFECILVLHPKNCYNLEGLNYSSRMIKFCALMLLAVGSALLPEAKSKPLPHRQTPYDFTNAFMQVLNPTTIRLRNILGFNRSKTQFSLYKADFRVSRLQWSVIPGSIKLEGTNQRPYTLEARGINIDGDISDWMGILPALSDPKGDSTTQGTGTDIKAVYLATDNTYLYILMTLWERPAVHNGKTTYFFQARTLPEDDSFSYYCGATFSHGKGTSDVRVHFRPKLTDPSPSLMPLSANINTFHGYAAYGSNKAAQQHFVEWKVPLSSFPIGAIVGKYVDAWVEASPTPSRDDTIDSGQGVYIITP